MKDKQKIFDILKNELQFYELCRQKYKIKDYALIIGRNAENIQELKAAREKKNGHLINTTAIR